MKKFREILLLVFIIFLSVGVNAQEKELWLAIDKGGVNDKLIERNSSVENFETFVLDLNSIKNRLINVPKKISDDENSRIIEFPGLSGDLQKFKIKENSVLHPDLAIKFPTIRSYSGQGVNDRTSTIHFTLKLIRVKST